MLFFLFFYLSINAQNLVLNPSFEEYNQCPFRIGYFNGNVVVTGSGYESFSQRQ